MRNLPGKRAGSSKKGQDFTMRRKLCKSATDRKIFGVCGGIAEYFGIDSTIVRLIWVLLVFGWGTGILAYIVAAIVMPD